MWKDFRRQSHGYTLSSLRQKQGEFHREAHRFFVASVVGQFPFGGFCIKQHIEGKLREPRLDVTPGGRRVVGKNVSPVALGVNKQVLLSELYERAVNRSVAVRVKLHCFSHDVRYFVVPPVVHSFHGVENSSLHGFQAVAYMGHGAFEYHIACIIQEPAFIHSRKFLHVSAVVVAFGDILRMELYFVVFVGHILLVLLAFLQIFAKIANFALYIRRKQTIKRRIKRYL